MRKVKNLKTSLHLLFLSFLILAAPLKSYSSAGTTSLQSNSKPEPKWERYTARDEEFSVIMPELPAVAEQRTYLSRDEERLEHIYAAYADGIAYVVESYDNPKHRQSLDRIIRDFYDGYRGGTPDLEETTFHGFKSKKRFVEASEQQYGSLTQFILTDKHVYIIREDGGDLRDPSVRKFYDSFTLSGKPEGKDIGAGSRNGPEPFEQSAASNNTVQPASATDNDKVINPKEATRKAVVVTRPQPRYTDEARKQQISGTVVLRAVFSSSGKVIYIRPVTKLPYGLTENAIEMARKIFFIPAMKDGKRVSQYIQIEYNFNLY